MPKHILCADDSVTMQIVVEITFAHTDYQVAAARSVDEALTAARRRRPDLVLADAVMPGKGGYDLCLALKSDPALRQVPVVIVCGNSQAYDEARGRQVGADATLAKPWDTQVFIEKVGEILQRVSTHGVAQPAAGVAPPSAPRAPSTTGVTTMPQRSPLGASGGIAAAPRPPATSTTPGMTASPGLARTVPAGIPARPGMPPTGGPGAALPKPPAGLPRPPLIRGAAISARPAGAPTGASGAVPGAAPRPLGTPQPTPVARPASTAPPHAAPPQPMNAPRPPDPRPQRSATIMGMPAMALPPAISQTTPAVAVPPPATAPTPPPVAARPVTAPPLAAPPPPAAAPTPPPAAPRPLPGTDALAKAAQRVAAAGMLGAQQAAVAKGLDPRGVEYEAIAKLSREIIEQIAWEVVPELAEIIIRQRLDEMKK